MLATSILIAVTVSAAVRKTIATIVVCFAALAYDYFANTALWADGAGVHEVPKCPWLDNTSWIATMVLAALLMWIDAASLPIARSSSGVILQSGLVAVVAAVSAATYGAQSCVVPTTVTALFMALVEMIQDRDLTWGVIKGAFSNWIQPISVNGDTSLIYWLKNVLKSHADATGPSLSV
jgi:hypothetical protein